MHDPEPPSAADPPADDLADPRPAVAPPVGGRTSARRLSVWWFLGPIMLALTALAAIGIFARAPYVLFAPGSARSTEPLIAVPKSLTHDSSGSVLFTTVSVIQKPTYAQTLWGWLRSDIDVLPYESVYGSSSVEQNRAEGRADMNQSKLVAAKVALEQLGYPVRSTGSGVLLLAVDPTFPAAKTLKAGDVIVSLDGVRVDTDDELVKLIQAHDPGDEVTVAFEPKGAGSARTVKTTLGKRPDADVAVLGVSIQTRDLRFTLPFKVDIDSGRVGGPSAGLAFTLGTLDRLTPGSLTGGHKVAVTGSMSADGQVLEVGGVRQKAVAAREAGAELFIVPTGEYKAALTTAGSMRVEHVDTLADALRILGKLGGNALKLGKPGLTAPSP